MLGVNLTPRAFLDRVSQEMARIDTHQVQALADAIFECYQKSRFVFVIGNGGSGSNASHLCEDLGKGTIRREDFENDKKKRLRILSLTDNTPYILAWGNDEGFDRVFVEQLKNLASPGDLLIAISGSGNSPNILRAVDWAHRNGVRTFGCTGYNGGKLKSLAQQNLHVPLDDMGIVESIHLTAFHWVVDNLYGRIGPADRDNVLEGTSPLSAIYNRSMTMTRDDLAEKYLAQLPYTPYPVQEEALLSWFTADQGVLVCAPTGTGKTLIAQAALFEALHTGSMAYYTTPLIALTEQKFQEMQASAVRWGFRADDVGLVTGNRRVNPDARILVVVAEILLNRLLHPAAFDFANVAAVVMDEFHSFADQERGIVWELSLSLLPKHIRLLLLSATVGNAVEFLSWLDRCHGRKVQLVESKDRKIPLTYEWVPDQLLNEQLVLMAKGDGHTRKMPALVFCFNRDTCWSVAEQLKGLPLLTEQQKVPLHAEINKLDWTQGVGPKMKQLLHRGVGVHHAGLLPKYRRVVEELFERKLLAAVICTETLASGINLPARSVVLASLVKGPGGKQKLVDASTAQQIFGRAGRPQYDDKGYVFALAHEDDVKILRWKEKYDQIPETTRDPGLLKAKKALKRKKPSRNETSAYWSEGQFKQLQGAPAGKLYSKGALPWRLLAYLLKISPEVSLVRNVLRKRLMDEPRILAQEKNLDRMLRILAAGSFVTLNPEPPKPDEENPPPYIALQATPTPELDKLLVFRSVHPLYAAFLLQHLGIANRDERLQALESVLEMPRPLLRYVRVPFPENLPPGPLVRTRLDEELIRRGLMIAKPEPQPGEEEEEDSYDWREEEVRPPTLAEKLRLLFDAVHPDVTDVNTQSVWAAAELLRFEGNFNKYVQSRDLVKQEGIVFRHFLRLILLCGEFAQVCPNDISAEAWQAEMRDISERLTASCREVDPASTEEMIEKAHAADVVEGEAAVAVKP